MQDARNELIEEKFPVKVFVTGIPSKVNSKLVQNYFGQFGHVELIDQNKNYHECGRQQSSFYSAHNESKEIARGLCLLIVWDSESLKNIMALSYSILFGRTIEISRYRTGLELFEYNKQINSRRVIVKKVPPSVSIHALTSILEAKFGQIYKIYKFEAESLYKAQKKARTRKHHSYSVEFEKENSAIKAAAYACLRLGNCIAYIEKYSKGKPLPFYDQEPQVSNYSSINITQEPSKKVQQNSKRFVLASHPRRFKTSQPKLDEGYSAHFLKPTEKKFYELNPLPKSPVNTIDKKASIRFNITLPK